MTELKMTIGFTVTTAKDGRVVDLDLDLHNADEESWQGLALQVRPLDFLKDEKLRLTRILGLLGRLAPQLKKDSDGILNSFLRWKSTDQFYSVDLGDVAPEEALPEGESKLERVTWGPVGSHNSGEGELSRIGDYEMAMTVLYGDLFHFDPDKALQLQSFGPMVLSWYAKAAENRVRQSTYYLRHAAAVIEIGWRDGLLPESSN
ncbi:hypothetical protein [Arthrobacter subterraneus]|uniref:hypothetical protein n=1 Tax=Arthrobacter subterraneus TaxID=335973 RepID=UPI0038004C8A